MGFLRLPKAFWGVLRNPRARNPRASKDGRLIGQFGTGPSHFHVSHDFSFRLGPILVMGPKGDHLSIGCCITPWDYTLVAQNGPNYHDFTPKYAKIGVISQWA